MRTFAGKTAVVTGAANGIGRALAARFADEGMRLVLADIDQPALDAVVAELKGAGHEVTGVTTDVSKQESVDELARRAGEAFGNVHLLCNNAGVTVAGGAPWERTLQDWEWCLGVNLWGIIHGLRSFVPGMIEHGEEGHVLNTGSVAGIALSALGIYSVSKHAVVGLSEFLLRCLKERGSRIGASVLCPDAVQTRIMSSYRNRPEELRNPPTFQEPSNKEMSGLFLRDMLKGWTPEQIAGFAMEGIRENRFWILPLTRGRVDLRARLDSLLSAENPDFSILLRRDNPGESAR